MKITLRRRGGEVFVALEGDLTAGKDLGDLRVAVEEVIGWRVRAVFLDLDGVRRLDCRGIGQLVRLFRRVDASGLAFGLVNVEARQRQLLERLHLARPLLVFDGSAEEGRGKAKRACAVVAARRRRLVTGESPRVASRRSGNLGVVTT